MRQKIGILSLGCPRNLVDSESILGRLVKNGHIISDMEDADVGIVNTCAFIEDAKKESIDAILDLIDLKRQGKLKKIIVYGCLSQRYRDILKNDLPEIDAFVGRQSLNHQANRFSLTPKHYAYLKICEGCVNKCSYCAIPKIKGKFASLDVDSILSKVDEFNRQKISELNIIGQDISGYGLDLYKKNRLSWLIEQITTRAQDIGWIRLLYLYPSRISDELLELIRDTPRLCKYIDMPIQHINDRILKLMHRATTRKTIEKTIAKIRKTIPGVALRTSIIVGFPSETENEFKELLQFVEDVKFERLGAFVYSQEEGTPAYNFKGQIPQQMKSARFNAIMSLQQKVSCQVNNKYIGETLQVLIDEKETGHYLGRTQYDAPEVDGLVYVHSKRKIKPGDFVQVKITDTLEYDLVGEEGHNEYS